MILISGCEYIPTEKDCNYDIQEYHLQYDISNEKYLISYDNYKGSWYLYKKSKFIFFLNNIDHATSFKDSCEAKGALQEYIGSFHNLKIIH